jgi:hypothetical protein
VVIYLYIIHLNAIGIAIYRTLEVILEIIFQPSINLKSHHELNVTPFFFERLIYIYIYKLKGKIRGNKYKKHWPKKISRSITPPKYQNEAQKLEKEEAQLTNHNNLNPKEKKARRKQTELQPHLLWGIKI